MNVKKKNYEDSVIYYVLLLLSGLNFLGSGSVIFLSFCCYSFFRRPVSKIRIGMNEIGIIILFLGVFFGSAVHFGPMDIIRSVNYLFPCFLGYMGYFHATDKDKYIKRTVFAIFLGFFIHILVTYIYNQRLGVIVGRVLYSVWTKQPTSVTIIGLFSSVVIGYSFYGIFLCKKRLIKILSLFAVVIVLLINSNTATRTPFLIFVITYVLVGSIYMLNKNFTKNIKILSSVLAVVVLVAIAFNLDLGGIKTKVLESPIAIRFIAERFETPRYEIMLYHFEHMWEHPFGGAHIANTFSHAHNYIQEGHDHYGIFAFVGLIINLFSALGNMARLAFKADKTNTDYILISFTVAMLIQMFMEPVLMAFPALLWLFLLMQGIIAAYVKQPAQIADGADV